MSHQIDEPLRRHLRLEPPPHPQALAIAQENLAFEAAMLSLASLVTHDIQSVREAFMNWVQTTSWPWREAVSRCVAYFGERGKFPFDIEEWPDVIGE